MGRIGQNRLDLPENRVDCRLIKPLQLRNQNPHRRHKQSQSSYPGVAVFDTRVLKRFLNGLQHVRRIHGAKPVYQVPIHRDAQHARFLFDINHERSAVFFQHQRIFVRVNPDSPAKPNPVLSQSTAERQQDLSQYLIGRIDFFNDDRIVMADADTTDNAAIPRLLLLRRIKRPDQFIVTRFGFFSRRRKAGFNLLLLPAHPGRSAQRHELNNQFSGIVNARREIQSECQGRGMHGRVKEGVVPPQSSPLEGGFNHRHITGRKRFFRRQINHRKPGNSPLAKMLVHQIKNVGHRFWTELLQIRSESMQGQVLKKRPKLTVGLFVNFIHNGKQPLQP